ncbi:hypothetical protein CGC58_04810 [Capnocytophaga stomatis]|uniref:Right handed beta helix domain-containing protein n=1 Tax=Capnocytophaga stomatis TaxID=1848904 RepID=A0A250FYN0_9FLAO|nr:right-handed parallel beta-helix repeat-containing protein [Capnocytophaga stomatis]ATA89096.1 hypothetical protein CGC58_04810 [Capnocytophaga stomatis]
MKKRIITSLLFLGIVPIIVFGGSSCTFEDVLEHANEKHKELNENINDREYDFIITPDNVTGDFRTFFQNVVRAYNNVLIKDGTYEIELVNGFGVFPKNGSTITFEKNAKIKVKPNSLEVYSVIDLRGKKDITLINPNLEGDKYTHLGKTGQWGFGIHVANCKNIVIKNAYVTKFWGDGIYLRNCENVKIYKPYLPDNRRQGLSILSGKDIEIHDLVAEDTGGQNPGYGIDIEPDWNGDSVTGLRIYRPIVRNNGNGTYYTGGINLSTHKSHILKPEKTTFSYSYFEIDIFDPIFEGDALMISAYTNYVKGHIKIYNPTFYKAKNTAVYIHNHQSDNFTTEIINPKFIDCVTSTKQSIYLAPILFDCSNLAVKSTGTKNIKITNPIIEASERATYKLAAIRNITANTFKEDLKNVTIQNLTVKGYEKPFYNHSGNRFTNSDLHNTFSLTISKESVLPSLNAELTVSKSLDGMAINHIDSTQETKLYLSDEIPISGSEFYYLNNSDNKTSLKILFGTKRNLTKNRIENWGTTKFSGIEVPFGGFVRLRKNDTNSWIVTSSSKNLKGI